MANPYIAKELFTFLTELKANNNREWFNEHKQIYVDTVRDPLIRFIADFAPLLSAISPHFLAIPKAVGGSLFRIYRDVRFSKNKDPYKTHAGIHFRHAAGKNVHAPGFYLHLEPGTVFVAMGLWQPEMSVLTAVRRAIADDPEAWTSIVKAQEFEDTFDFEGSSLKRPPKGFDPEHPLIDTIKQKDFVGVHRMSQADALDDDFMFRVAQTWSKGARFMEFLTEASGQPF